MQGQRMYRPFELFTQGGVNGLVPRHPGLAHESIGNQYDTKMRLGIFRNAVLVALVVQLQVGGTEVILQALFDFLLYVHG